MYFLREITFLFKAEDIFLGSTKMCIFPNAKFRQIKLSISTSTTSCWFTMQGIFFVCFPFKFEAKSVYKLKASQNKIHFFIMLYVTSDDKAFWHKSEVYFWYSEGTPFKTWKVGIFQNVLRVDFLLKPEHLLSGLH